jgi:hypothetical protein
MSGGGGGDDDEDSLVIWGAGRAAGGIREARALPEREVLQKRYFSVSLFLPMFCPEPILVN